MNRATLIFLHGWCSTPDDFRYQIAYFQGKYPIIAPNYSDWIKNSPTIRKEYLNWCLIQLQDMLDKIPPPAYVIGHSMGGILAMLLAKVMPHKIQKLIIIDTSFPISQLQFQQMRSFCHSVINPMGRSKFEELITARFTDPTFDDPTLMTIKRDEIVETFYSNPNAFSTIMIEASEIAATSAIQILQKIEVPTAYLASKTSHANILRLKEVLPPEAILFFNTGHFIMLNDPNALNAVLRSLIA